MLIAISGVDGSGKTTLATRLIERFEALDLDAALFYGRFVPGKIRYISKVFRRLRSIDGANSDFPGDYAEQRHSAAQNPLFRVPARTSVFLEYLVRTAPQARGLLRTHHIVVCDRYVLDTWAMDIVLGKRTVEMADLAQLRILSGLMPAPKLAYFLDVPPEIATDRRPHGLPNELLVEAVDHYRQGSKYLRMSRLDGTRTVEENTEEILRHLSVGQGVL